MKIITNSKNITTLEVDDKVVFGDLEYIVCKKGGYFLRTLDYSSNDKIFTILGLSKIDFIKNLGINILSGDWIFPKVKSLEAITVIVSALLKEYERQNELPKTWEEFCEKYHIKEKESFINSASDIDNLRSYSTRAFRSCDADRNLCTSKQEAEAFLALMQLRQLRKAYVKDWEPDWNTNYPKYCIICDANQFDIVNFYHISSPLSFPTEELATQFLTNFKDLLEIAKPLL